MEIGKIFLGLAKSEMRAHLVLHIYKSAEPEPLRGLRMPERVSPVWVSSGIRMCLEFHSYMLYAKHFWAPAPEPHGPQLFVNNNKLR